jgi:glycosyltransferase involved in cell wall biosynthesis
MSVSGSLDLTSPATFQEARAALDIHHLVVADRIGHPTAANGVHNVARSLVREQQAAGDRARLTLLAYGDVAVDGDSRCATRAIQIHGRALRGRTVWLRQDVIDALLEDADESTIFHIHGGREPLLLGLGRALRHRGVPYAITVHGRFSHIYDSAGRSLKRTTELYLKMFERSLLEGAKFVQALAPEEEWVLSRIAPRATIKVVGNGAYSSRLGRVPARPAARPPSASFPHFAYCGRYEIEHKGLDLMIEGFALYRRSGGIGHLTMIGTGPVRMRLVQMAEEFAVSDVVHIHGPMFGAERDAILQACDWFVMTSRFEGVPLAALEAAMLGMPLVVTSGTSLRTAVEASSAGIPVLDLTAQAVCTAMHQAGSLSAAEWQARSNAAYGLAMSSGDWTVIAARLRNLYLR